VSAYNSGLLLAKSRDLTLGLSDYVRVLELHSGYLRDYAEVNERTLKTRIMPVSVISYAIALQSHAKALLCGLT
jgi:hypothetical protein